MAANWYETHIEEGIRDLVRLLRDNGFNTECSCGHEKYVQCQYITDGEIQRLDNLLFNAGYRDYKIIVIVERRKGNFFGTMDVRLQQEDA